MGHISGVFSHANAGRLRVTLKGTFKQGTGRDAGFPSGTSNLLIKGTVNGTSMLPIDRFAPVSYMELDYPGGGAAWLVSTSTVANFYGGGTASYGFSNLDLILMLLKK